MDKRNTSSFSVILVVLAVLVVGVGIIFTNRYNTMVSLEEAVATRQANIQSCLQSRLDRINELMPAVQGAMDHESEIYQEITALRSGTEGILIDEDGNMTIDPDATKEELENADAASSQIVYDINTVVESYPNLNSTTLMSDFMTGVEGIENRISVAREEYNEAVQEYNTYIRSFPQSTLAGILGFETKDTYQASDAAQNIPEVNFN